MKLVFCYNNNVYAIEGDEASLHVISLLIENNEHSYFGIEEVKVLPELELSNA